MLESSSYREAKEMVQNFNSKLNFRGDFTSIDTETKLFFWISENLLSTEFSTYLEAEDFWNSTKNSVYYSYNDNIGFYKAIKGNPRRHLELIIGNLPEPEIVSPNSECSDNLTICTTGVSTTYSNAIESTKQAESNGTISEETANTQYTIAQLGYELGMNNCQGIYLDCVFVEKF